MQTTAPVAGLVSPIQDVLNGLSVQPATFFSVQRLFNDLRSPSAINTTNAENIYYGANGTFDYSDVPNMIGYGDSSGVAMNTWFDQSITGNNLTDGAASSMIAPGNSQVPYVLGGSIPAPLIGAYGVINTKFSSNLTFVCLYVSSLPGSVYTATNWRTAPSNATCWMDGRVGAGNNDFFLGLSGSKLLVGTGTSGGSDTGLISSSNAVTFLPALIVVRRRASDGFVEIRINRSFDSSATLSVGNLTLPSTLSVRPQSNVSEMWIFNDYLPDNDVLFLEKSIFDRYDYPT